MRFEAVNYVWQANRYWITDCPGPYENVGWNAVFLPHRIIKTTAKWIIAEHITSRVRIFLDRNGIEKIDGLYHSKYHEYFYLKRPEYKRHERKAKRWQSPVFNGDYAVLGLEYNCTDRELKSAYRRLSRKTHPDTGGTHEKFIKICNAYNTIMAARGI